MQQEYVVGEHPHCDLVLKYHHCVEYSNLILCADIAMEQPYHMATKRHHSATQKYGREPSPPKLCCEHFHRFPFPKIVSFSRVSWGSNQWWKCCHHGLTEAVLAEEWIRATGVHEVVWRHRTT